MLQTIDLSSKHGAGVFAKETLVKGQPAHIECIEIQGQIYSIDRGVVNVVSLEDEWYEDVRDPIRVVEVLKSRSEVGADLLTFWQRLPDIQPKYELDFQWESIAALPISSVDHWFNKQISGRTRSLIRKAKKEGVEVRETAYDDEFVRGMTEIFNETPIRQGRRFWHYGKDFDTIKRQFSRYLFREELAGAYLGNELIGFIMLGNAGGYAVTGQIISKLRHRDKSTNNVLIAKAVEMCAQKKVPYLVYLHWTNDSLAEFKRRCGFEETKVPRYSVPLTQRGRLALKFGIHRGLSAALPDPLIKPLKRLRRLWNDWRSN
jgi:hypothetical protein